MKVKAFPFFILGWFVFSGFILYLFLASLRQKVEAQRLDRIVAFEIDFQDIQAFASRENKSLTDLLKSIQTIPATVISLDAAVAPETEKIIRSFGFKILWRGYQEEGSSPVPILKRIQEEDGVLAYGDVALGFPIYLNEVVAKLKKEKGVLPLFEFSSQDGSNFLARSLESQVIKGHCLQGREVLNPQIDLWKNRLVRAVKFRWVRLLAIRLSPGLNWQENIDFQKSTADLLRRSGFTIREPVTSPLYKPEFRWGQFPWERNLKIRILLILIFSIFTPVIGIAVINQLPKQNYFGSFLGFSIFSIYSGFIIHALGSHPQFILGISSIPGIKIQLLLPLLMGFILLMRKEEIARLLKTDIKIWHALFAGGVGFALIGIYLMRSGNAPLIPVLIEERHFRDFLENFFGARPRFKEFLIGHPALLVGLWLRSKGIGNQSFMSDGRFLMIVGMIGQISILNSFQHIHSSFFLEQLRSLHGIWLGLIIGFAIILVFKKWKEN